MNMNIKYFKNNNYFDFNIFNEIAINYLINDNSNILFNVEDFNENFINDNYFRNDIYNY